MCVELTLEELDQVFSVPTWKHTAYQLRNCVWHIRRYVLFQKGLERLPPLIVRGGSKEDEEVNGGKEKFDGA